MVFLRRVFFQCRQKSADKIWLSFLCLKSKTKSGLHTYIHTLTHTHLDMLLAHTSFHFWNRPQQLSWPFLNLLCFSISDGLHFHFMKSLHTWTRLHHCVSPPGGRMGGGGEGGGVWGCWMDPLECKYQGTCPCAYSKLKSTKTLTCLNSLFGSLSEEVKHS